MINWVTVWKKDCKGEIIESGAHCHSYQVGNNENLNGICNRGTEYTGVAVWIWRRRQNLKWYYTGDIFKGSCLWLLKVTWIWNWPKGRWWLSKALEHLDIAETRNKVRFDVERCEIQQRQMLHFLLPNIHICSPVTTAKAV